MEEERRLIATDGTELVYWRRAADDAAAGRPPLLLVHGAASNHTRWSELLDATSLKGTRDFLRPDLRGNGASMTRGRLDREIWSRDLLEILDAEGDRQAVLVGHSLGAQIGVDFAHRYPSRTRALALIDPVFRRALTGPRRRMARAMPIVALATRAIRVLNALGLRRREIRAERDLRELDERTRAALREGESHEEIARRYSALGPILRHMPLANYLQQLHATVAPLPPLEELDLPVLVLLSAGSTFADPEINRGEIARLPRASTVEIDANHWPLTERPEAVREALETWAAGL